MADVNQFDVKPEPSTIGIRATWVCVLCRVHARTYQLVCLPATAEDINLPSGWSLVGRWSICSEHAQTLHEQQQSD